MKAQRTIDRTVEIAGRGLFTGEEVTLRFRPAPPDTGVVFVREDQRPPIRIAACVDNVAKRLRRTSIRNGSVQIETIEHCMSALAGLGLVTSVEEVDSTEPGGTVVGQEPGAGTQVQGGATVILRVSNAPPSYMVTVPPVGGLGYSVQHATNILTQHHLNATIEYYPTSDYDPGVVIQQDPVAGVVVPAGSYVTLTVAEAPPATTTTTTTTTTLPPTTTTSTTTTTESTEPPPGP